MPDITFLNSPVTEENRWRDTRKIIASSWYQEHGFLVVADLNEKVQHQIQVIFPKEHTYTSVDVLPYEQEWKKVEGEFWGALEEQLPGAIELHDKVIVDVGRLGTVSSSSWTGVRYYLRVDRSVADLAAMIINQTMYLQRKQLGVTWTKREALMDFIMTRPVMKKLFPKFEPVYHQLSKVSPKIRRESEAYVRSLGIVPATRDFELKNGKILIKGVVVARELTKQEKAIMNHMIKKTGDLMTYDDLADILWGEGEFKSFWAINKTMQRLRGRLEILGIHKERIEAVRGQGYLLK